jgi:arylsulfatase A-like enzyme
MINRDFMRDEADFPGPQCFAAGFEFIRRNHTADNWLLQIECFDPHEPFFAPERFRRQYQTGYNGPILDWPFYEKVQNNPQEIAEIRANYSALVAMCDDYFGQLLDRFDEYDLWDDTALILTTDHGFLLAEHDWWGKNRMPYFEEISHIPLMMYHPDAKTQSGERRSMVTQTTDIMPTLLDCFAAPLPAEVRGHSLLPCLSAEKTLRDTAIFGMFGGPIGATDGRYAYYLYPQDLMAPGLYEYTLMPMHLNTLFTPKELRTAQLAEPFDFTKDVPILRIDALQDARRIPIHDGQAFGDTGTKLYDLLSDPQQQQPIRNEAVEQQLRGGIRSVLQQHDAPSELYGRYGLADTA